MQVKQIATLMFSLMPVIFGVISGHENDLTKVAELLESTATELRTFDDANNPKPLPVS